MKRNELVAACALDALLGDPDGWPHPVRAVGAAIAAVDRDRVRRPPALELAHGALVSVGIVVAAAVFARVAGRGAAARVVLAASTLAGRSLVAAIEPVRRALAAGDLVAARAAVRRLVGRDVAELDDAEIARAALEGLAESLGDGIAAPLLALVAGGVAGGFAFKAISTLDSMIGHREEPYTWFGRAAARADDLANLLPARLAALAIAVAAALLGADPAAALRTAVREARRHASPNAGWPEAALAGALGVRLGGTNRYDGVTVVGAVFNPGGRAPSADDLGRGMCVVTLATLLLAGAAALTCPP